MTRRKRSTAPLVRHQLTDTWFSLIGARKTDSGRCFVVRAEADPRERMFLVEGFAIDFVDREALFTTLEAREAKRQRIGAAEARHAENERHRRLRDAEDETPELHGREASRDAELENESTEDNQAETISTDDSEGHEPLEVLESDEDLEFVENE